MRSIRVLCLSAVLSMWAAVPASAQTPAFTTVAKGAAAFAASAEAASAATSRTSSPLPSAQIAAAKAKPKPVVRKTA